MKRVKYNEVKIQTLRAIRNGKWRTPKEIHVDVCRGRTRSIHATRMSLMRYHKQGLVKRKRRGRTYNYKITQRGAERLDWLTGKRIKADQ